MPSHLFWRTPKRSSRYQFNILFRNNFIGFFFWYNVEITFRVCLFVRETARRGRTSRTERRGPITAPPGARTPPRPLFKCHLPSVIINSAQSVCCCWAIDYLIKYIDRAISCRLIANINNKHNGFAIRPPSNC